MRDDLGSNCVGQSRTYDPAGQTTDITTRKGFATLETFAYGYDAAGHLTSDSTDDASHTYQYDPVNQLTAVGTTLTNGTTANASYTATPGGLLTTTTVGNTLAYNAAQ